MLACSSCHGSGVNVMGERCFCPYGREGGYQSYPHPNGVWKKSGEKEAPKEDRKFEGESEAWWDGFIEGVKASISVLESELAKAP